MQKSIIAPAEKLQAKLMMVSMLVDQFEQKKHHALQDWLSWLSETEALFKEHNYSQVSKLAGLRAEILAIGYESLKRREKQRAQNQRSLATIGVAQDIVQERYQRLADKIEKVREILKQIILVAKEAGFLEQSMISGENFTQFVEQFLWQMRNHEQLKPSINLAIATVGKYDTMRIIAEEIELN